MSVTVTQQEVPRAKVLEYRLQLVTPSMVEGTLDLAEEYVGNRDPYSIKILTFIVETAQRGALLSQKERDVYVAGRLHTLVTEVLVDHRGKFCTDLVVDAEGMPWSLAYYRACQASGFGFSPFTMQPFSDAAPVAHELANRVASVVLPLLPDGMLISAQQAPTLEEMMLDYKAVIDSRMALQNQALAQVFSWAGDRVEQMGERLSREAEEHRVQSEAAAAAATREVKEAVNARTESHRGERETLEGVVKGKMDELDQVQKELEEEAEKERALHGGNASLRSQATQLRSEVQAQQQHSPGVGGWCTIL